MGRPTQKSRVDLVLVALSSPLLVGIYQEGRLVQKIQTAQKTSEALPVIFKDILAKYEVERVYFAKGPGSFMSIKLVYIFLKTLQIAKGIELFGCEAFAFNQNAPIKAFGNLYFVKENGKIVTKKFDVPPNSRFVLPKRLKELECNDDISPLYILPAVKG